MRRIAAVAALLAIPVLALAQARYIHSKLPLSFEADQGRFLSRGHGYTLFLTPTEAVLSTQQDVLRMKLAGSNPRPTMTAQGELPGKSNYFVGNDPAKWRADVPNYSRVEYRDIYPGVNLVFYGNQQQLEYDFVVQPGADPAAIRLTFGGARKLRIDESGDLVLSTSGGEVRQRKPLIYQDPGKPIAGRYVLKGRRQVGFEIAAYDRARPLWIDPVLVYATFLGGSGDERGRAMTVDSSGNVYVTGRTSSTNFPTASPAQAAFKGVGDAFVTKFNAAGTALLYSTYLGGSGDEDGYGIAVDSAGNAYVGGVTTSIDFPFTPGAFQTTYGGSGGDGFVTKLNATGSALVYSTYLGAGSNESVYSIAVDSSGNAYVIGDSGGDFPTTPGAFQTSFTGGIEAFVAKLNPTGTALVYSSHLGGSGDDRAQSIAVDSSGNAYVAGWTRSTDFPTTAGAFQTTNGGGPDDAFVVKVNPAGTALLYSTYLGGSGPDQGYGIAIDSSGNAYVTGITASTNFPTVNPWQAAIGGARDAFAAKLNATGSALVYSTYLGGSDNEQANGIAVDLGGNAYITGYTRSPNYPTANPLPSAACPATISSPSRTFVTRLSAAGSAAVYSTCLANSDFIPLRTDDGPGIAVDALGNAYVAGQTTSSLFATTAGAFQTALAGPSDAFVAKIGQSAKLWMASVPSSQVFRYDVSTAGAPTLETTLTDPSFDNPYGVVFSATNEMFVTNRHVTAAAGGSVSRFLSPQTSVTPHGTITSGAFGNPHLADFRNGELFVANPTFDNVVRFVFDAAGNAAPNGAISAGISSGTPRGVAVSPWGELFVTQCCGVNTVNRYSFDGSAAFANGTITGSGLNNPHGMAFSARGELFVANADGNNILRFTFDAAHVASANGQITGNGLSAPDGVTFSPWGELFVGNSSAAQVSRFTFDAAFNAVANGTFSTPTGIGGLAFAPEVVAADLALTNAGSPDPVTVGSNLTYTITVTNNGPSWATGVTVSDTLPSSATFVSATPSQGSCSGTSTVTCNLGPLNNGASATLTIIVTTTVTGSLSNTASVTAAETDPVAANNSATATNTVNAIACTSTFTNGSSDGQWTTATNWSPSGVPGSSANVCISSGFTVTLSSGSQAVNSVNSSGLLIISGGSLSIAVASAATNLTLSGGTLSGAGTLTISGAAIWTGGQISGAGVTNITSAGTLSMSGAADKDLFSGHTLNNAGAATWTGTGNFRFSSGSVFNNQSGALFDVQSDSLITCVISCPGTEAFNNIGMFRKSAGTGTSIVGIQFNNSGTVQAQAATLSLNAGTSAAGSSGSFSISSGALLNFNGGTHTLTSTAIFSGAGTLGIIGGTVKIDSAATAGSPVTVNSKFSLSGGTLTGPGVVAINGTATWSGGQMLGPGTTNLASTGTLALSGSPDKDFFNDYILNNSGVVTWTGTGNFRFSNGAVFNNQSGAVFDAQNDSQITCVISCPGTEAFNNIGTFRKSAGTGMTAIGLKFNSTGAVQAQAATLSLNGGTSAAGDSGSFSISSGALLNFNGGTHTLTSTVTVSGAGTLGIVGGTVKIDASATSGSPVSFNSIFTMSGGTLTGPGVLSITNAWTWVGGQLIGPGTVNIAGTGTLSMSGGADKDLFSGYVLNNSNTVTWTGTGNFRFSNGTVVNNQSGALFDAQNDSLITCVISCPGTEAFNNIGTFRKSAGTGTSNVGIQFNNSGTVQAQAATLSLNGGTNAAGDTGSFSISSGALLNFNGGIHTLTSTAIFSGAGTLGIIGGTVKIDSSATAGSPVTVNSIFSMSGGTLNGPGVLAINGTATWSGGQMVGPGSINLTATAALALSGSADKDLLNGYIFNNNSGTVTWTGTGNFRFSNGTVFNNQSGALFDAQNDSQILCVISCPGTEAFNNIGTFRKSAGTGATTVGLKFNNTGIVEVLAATLSLNGGTSAAGDSGSFSIAAGAQLTFNGGTHTLTSTAMSSGAGTLNISGGTVKIDSSATSASPAAISKLTFSGGTLTGPGVLALTGTATWTGGQMLGPGVVNVAATATMSMSGAADKDFLNGYVLNHAGTVVWTGTGNFRFSNGSVFNNQSGALFDAQNDSQILCVISCPGTEAFNNIGIFRKSVGTSATTIGVKFNNSGAVQAQAATLSLNNGTSAAGSSGSFSISSGAFLTFNGGTYTLTSTANSSGAGTFSIIGGTVQIDASATAASPVVIGSKFLQTGGTLLGPGVVSILGAATWSGGQMFGPGTANLASTGTLALSGSPDKDLFNGYVLNNAGTITWTGTGNFRFSNGSTFNNLLGAVFDAQNDSQALCVSSCPGTEAFNNIGTFQKSAGTGTTTINSSLKFNNSGAVSAQSGVLSFAGTSFTQTAGTVALAGGNLAGGTLNISGGTLSGAGAISASVTNAAMVSPGSSAGVINITGNYTQTSTGTLNVEVGGYSAGTGYDQLNITGTATLAGTLNVSLIGGFTPRAGVPFPFLNFGSRSGGFTTISGASLGGGLSFTTTFAPTVMTLVAVSPYYSNDFEGTVGPEWSTSLVSTTPVGGRKFLGEFGNADATSLTLISLPAHSAVTVDYDLYVLKSWDGNGPSSGPDEFDLSVAGGPTLLHTTFANAFSQPQAFPGTYPGGAFSPRTGALEGDTLGYSFFFGDTVYRFSFTFPHTASSVTLNFSGNLKDTGPGIGNESWGLDNVRVTLAPVPDAVTPFYSNNFEGTVGSEWSTSLVSSTPTGGRKFLGEFGADGVNAANLALTGLPAHTGVTVSYDLFILKSWDGNGNLGSGPDVFDLSIAGGPTLVHSTFANVLGTTQSFPGPYPGPTNPTTNGAAEVNTLGYTFTGDSVYHMTQTFPHTAGSLTLNFSASLPDGSPGIANESWGLDNVSVGLIGTSTYQVGDAAPFTGDSAGLFGDGTLNNFDLIAALRAVTSIPGARPPDCSDRFDAMDANPKDGATRGGDGALDNFDLIVTLRRVTSLDTTRPTRTSRGACAAGAPLETLRRKDSGLVRLGEPEILDGVVRVPVYLRSAQDLELAALSFGLGLEGESAPLRMTPGEAGAPTLVDNGISGTLAVAWLEGLKVTAGQRVLLGYVTVPRNTSSLRIYAVQTN